MDGATDSDGINPCSQVGVGFFVSTRVSEQRARGNLFLVGSEAWLLIHFHKNVFNGKNHLNLICHFSSIYRKLHFFIYISVNQQYIYCNIFFKKRQIKNCNRHFLTQRLNYICPASPLRSWKEHSPHKQDLLVGGNVTRCISSHLSICIRPSSCTRDYLLLGSNASSARPPVHAALIPSPSVGFRGGAPGWRG